MVRIQLCRGVLKRISILLHRGIVVQLPSSPSPVPPPSPPPPSPPPPIPPSLSPSRRVFLGHWFGLGFGLLVGLLTQARDSLDGSLRYAYLLTLLTR